MKGTSFINKISFNANQFSFISANTDKISDNIVQNALLLALFYQLKIELRDLLLRNSSH